MGDRSVGATGQDGGNRSHALFDNFVQASTCKGTLKAFQELCDHLDVKPTESRIFYHKLKSKLNYWKAKALWAKLDKRACQKEYKKGRACVNSKVTGSCCHIHLYRSRTLTLSLIEWESQFYQGDAGAQLHLSSFLFISLATLIKIFLLPIYSYLCV